MSKIYIAVSGICLCLANLVTPLMASNVLKNPGCERSVPHGEARNVEDWITYGPTLCSVSSETGSEARRGINYFKVFQGFSGAIDYSGIYQDCISGPGATYTADGWAKVVSSDALAGQNEAWIEVTFRDVGGTMLALYKSSVITTNELETRSFLKDSWVHLMITNQYDPNNFVITNATGTLVAPPGTAFVRYQITFQGDAAGSPGSVYFDDLSLNMTVADPAARSGNWNMIWHDEFDQPDGSEPDPTKWGYDIGDNGWGNNELENYITSTNCVRIEDGKLIIEARQEIVDDTTNYTSGRLLTKGKCSWTYGRIEARIKISRSQGIWPAFWLLGTNMDSVYWPACGEIDIMENIGRQPGIIHGTIHGPGYSGASGIGGKISLPDESAFADEYHIYAIEWEPNRIRWFMDYQPYFTATPAILPNGAHWIFDQPGFLLLNLAVGGNWPGYPNGKTILPQRMLVDYVRVYKKAAPPEINTLVPSAPLAPTGQP